MRFFLMTCVFCMLIASVGCMTNNWSSPLFRKPLLDNQSINDTDPVNTEEAKPNFWNSKFGQGAGLDPRAQAIEKRLGL